MLAKIESTDRHIAYRYIEKIDDALIQEMKSKFLLYQKRHVLLASSFADMKWKLDDQVKKVTINFEKGSCLRAFVKEKLNLSYEQFVLAQKLYVIMPPVPNILYGAARQDTPGLLRSMHEYEAVAVLSVLVFG